MAPQVQDWQIQTVADGVVRIRLAGIWNTSCIRRDPVAVSRQGQIIRVHATANEGPTQLCFQAGRPWDIPVHVAGLQPGDYEIHASHSRPGVPEIVTPFGQHTFTYTPPPAGTAAQSVPFSSITWMLLALAMLAPVAWTRRLVGR
ncbi:hypothetical protein [Pseudofulvimonas gallinarii]|uniref:Uncharacterized protein n=1 Tax=Pseudofulvimonas gallinarii TaxID=634155 RepID=A0A4R3L1Q5_9GAMM|nr:hypothetical protein [Pseudofulvimonas gallinarii]TCS93521.1 hypothetical protein EDC25_12717 [Pseudofulvimonas gallinarii]THD14448.1 hypothetical protein B1808_04090 [Pseudofulvimonas gallinarii]